MSNYYPPFPPYQHDLPIFTFEDAVESVLDAFNLKRSGSRHERLARRAVLAAYRDLPHMHRWPYFEKRGQIITEASYSTGTIAYDHTGGSNEREVTISGGTVPSGVQNDPELYRVHISDQQYPIESYVSSTVVTLKEGNNPGADVAAGTSYAISKPLYKLPTDFRRGSELVPLNGAGWMPYYVDSVDLLAVQFSFSQPTEPYQFTYRAGDAYYGGVLLEFGPPPSTSRTFDYMYARTPRPLMIERYTEGTVTVTGTGVEGSDTAFVSNMKGSVIRFPLNSKKDTLPTSVIGTVDGTDNPFAAERIITTVTDSDTLVIDSAVSETVSGAVYTISDPIDFEPGAMLTAFLRMAEVKFAIDAGKQDLQMRSGLAKRDLLFAKEAATRSRDAGRQTGADLFPYEVNISTGS